MSSVQSVGSAASLISATKVYSPLDTNEDGVVSAEELAAATTSDENSTSAKTADEAKTTEQTASDQVVSALLQLQETGTASTATSSSAQSILQTYLNAGK